MKLTIHILFLSCFLFAAPYAQADNDDHKMREAVEKAIEQKRKHLHLDAACFAAGVLLSVTNVIAHQVIEDKNKLLNKLFIDTTFLLGLAASACGALSGAHHYIDYQHAKNELP